MKRSFFAIVIALSVVLSSCAAVSTDPQETQSGSVSGTDGGAVDYDGFVESLKGDPERCGYRYVKNGAEYTILQRGNDVRVEFKSTIDPDMDMSAYRIDGKTVYVKGTTYFEDKDNQYTIPTDKNTAAPDWIYDEIRNYGEFEYYGESTEDGVVFDILKGTKTEENAAVPDFDYDEYELFFTYKDGQNYHGKYFDCSDKTKNLFSGDVPSEFLTDNAWTVDIEGKRVYNTATGESYSSAVDLIDTFRYDPSTPKEITKEAEIVINRDTRQVYKVIISSDEGVDEYFMLYPDVIEAINTDGLEEMTAEEAEYAATMILLMIKSL